MMVNGVVVAVFSLLSATVVDPIMVEAHLDDVLDFFGGLVMEDLSHNNGRAIFLLLNLGPYSSEIAYNFKEYMKCVTIPMDVVWYGRVSGSLGTVSCHVLLGYFLMVTSALSLAPLLFHLQHCQLPI